MIAWPKLSRPRPIGIDIGTASVNLLQLDPAASRVAEFGRWQLSSAPGTSDRNEEIVDAVKSLREARRFRGRTAVVGLTPPDLVIVSIRIPHAAPEDRDALIRNEVAGRLPFPIQEADLRHLDVGEVRQGDSHRRELIVFACHRPQLDQQLELFDRAGVVIAAIDPQPLAILRAFKRQERRKSDATARLMVIHIGATETGVIIAQGNDVRFVKYVDMGGQDFDRAASLALGIGLRDAAAMRARDTNRSEDNEDELNRSINDAVRPVLEDLAREIGMCIRYHSVTFRGRPIDRVVLSGSEATESLRQSLETRLELGVALGNPLRSYEQPQNAGRLGVWDVATGLALREVSHA